MCHNFSLDTYFWVLLEKGSKKAVSSYLCLRYSLEHSHKKIKLDYEQLVTILIRILIYHVIAIANYFVKSLHSCFFF